MIPVWTDYPFDKPGEKVEPYKVIFLSWDGDKYATVKLQDGREKDVKVGYLFLDRKLQQPLEPL